MAERRGGRKAALAGMYLPSVLGVHTTEIEYFDRGMRPRGDDLVRPFQHAEGLRALAGAGVLAATRAVDQEKLRRRRGLVVSALCGAHGIACPAPIISELIARIGKVRTGSLRARAFAACRICLPSSLREACKFCVQTIKGDVDELADKALLELGFRQRRVRHHLPWFGHVEHLNLR